MHNYNGWNLPFVKTAELNATSDSHEFPNANYDLKVDPNAYFSIVFVAQDYFDLRDKDLRTLNYTFYGSENYEFTGFWLEMNMFFNKIEIAISADQSQADYYL